MKTTFYKMAFLGALVSGVALLAVIGCRPDFAAQACAERTRSCSPPACEASGQVSSHLNDTNKF